MSTPKLADYSPEEIAELIPYLTPDEQAELLRLLEPSKPDPIEWILNNFYLYDTGELITLHPCQIYGLRKVFETDVNGDLLYTTVIWSWPKKSAKSSVIAAIADYKANFTPRASIKLVANDLKQADNRVGFYLRENIRHSQRKGKRQDIVITPSGFKITYPNGAIIESIPIDPSGEAGGNDDLIILSELWGWKSEAHQRMFSEMTISPNKWGRAQRIADTYAGFSNGGSPILERLYETGVVQGRQLTPEWEIYENQSASMLTAWVTKPLFKWQTEAYYAQEASVLTPSEFNRMHRNQWVSDTDAFVPIEWWDAAQIEELPVLEADQQWVLALDAAVSGDCFGMVALSRHDQKVAVRYVKKWTPPPGGKLDFAGPETEIRRLVDSGRIACIAYDPYQLHDLATRLRNELSVWFFEFPQGQMRLLADKMLYDYIREKRVLHTGEPDLRQHVGNANATSDADKLRIVKRQENMKIDLCVALSMATYRSSTMLL